MVAGDDHHRAAYPLQLRQGEPHGLLADPRIVEEVAGDQHDIDVELIGFSDDGPEAFHRRGIPGDMDIRCVQHPNLAPAAGCLAGHHRLARKGLIASRKPAVLPPCTLCPTFGTVTSRPSGRDGDETFGGISLEDVGLAAADQQDRERHARGIELLPRRFCRPPGSRR